ncbi:MAG: Crp/Fnr family transcriptional regulator [Candidatus Goldiibacteriota bacterium]
MKNDITPFLKGSGLFGEISQKGISMIAQESRENKFRKGDIIFSEGDSGETLHIIKSGKVKITKYTKEGKTKTLAILKEKDSFGEMAILTRDARSATVEALMDVVTISLSKENFIQLIKQEPSIPMQIIKTLSQRLARADRDIKNMALGDARSRVACVLMDLKDDLQTMKLTHQDIADLAGLTRETTTRTLTQLEADDIIAVNNRQFKIIDNEKMKELTI